MVFCMFAEVFDGDDVLIFILNDIIEEILNSFRKEGHKKMFGDLM